MPTGTRVHKCVDKLKGTMSVGGAIATCQSSTGQSFSTGQSLTGGNKKGGNKRGGYTPGRGKKK